MRRTAVALALAVILTAATGCGESSLTQAELRSQANAICEDVVRDAIRMAREAGFGQRAAPRRPRMAGQRFIDRYQARLEQAVAELRGLEPPSELQSTYERFVSNLSEVAELQTAIANDERPGEARLERVRQEQERVTARLRLRSCNF